MDLISFRSVTSDDKNDSLRNELFRDENRNFTQRFNANEE
jgi:hypothetical protein